MGDKYNEYKIAWLSANKLGYELLKESLESKINVDSIITLSNDSRTIMYDSVGLDKWHELGKKNGLDVYSINHVNNNFDFLKDLRPDLIVMCGWRQVLDKNILNIPKDGVIGFHPTLLPKGRGPAPIINSILDKDFKYTGLTMFYASDGLDNGDIIGQEKFDIDRNNDYASDVYEKVISAGKTLVNKYLPLVIEGKAPRFKQNDLEATVFPKPSLKNNFIDHTVESFEDASRKVRALSHPYAGAYVLDNGQEIRIWDVQSLEKYYKK